MFFGGYSATRSEYVYILTTHGENAVIVQRHWFVFIFQNIFLFKSYSTQSIFLYSENHNLTLKSTSGSEKSAAIIGEGFANQLQFFNMQCK